MEISEITDPGEFLAMRQEWNALVEASAQPLLYSRHEWLWAWWRTYGEGRDLHVVQVREQGRLWGVFPLIAAAVTLGRVLPGRVAVPLAQGQCSYQDAVIGRGWEEKAVTSLLAHLQQRHPDWDALVLRKLHPGSVWLSLAARGELGRQVRVWPEKLPAPYTYLPRRGEDLEGGWGHRLRSNQRRHLRALQKLGQVEMIDLGDGPDMLAALPHFLAQHEARWGLENLLALGYERYREFVVALTEEMAGSGLPHLLALTLDDKPVAYEYVFDYHQVRYSFMLAWDPAYRHCGVGSLVVQHALLTAVARGLDIYDFGAGTEEYKHYFSAYDRIPWGLAVPLKPGLKGRLLAYREAREK